MKFLVLLAIGLYFLAVFFRIYQYYRGIPMSWHGWSTAVMAMTLHGYIAGVSLVAGHPDGFDVFLTFSLAGFLLSLTCLALECHYGDVFFSVLGYPIVIILLTGGFLSTRLLEGPSYTGGWFFAHVLAAVSGEIFFLLAGIAGLTYLYQVRRLKAKNRLRATFFFPPLTRLDWLILRFSLVGFACFTLGIGLGAVWSSKTFGVIPLTGYKQLISLTVWSLFAALLGGRKLIGMAGPKTAWLAILGCLAGLALVMGTGSHQHWMP